MTIAETKLSTFLTHTFIVLTFCIGSNTFANQKIDSSQYLEYFQQGDYHSALAGFQSLSDQNPLATELKFYHGRSLFRDGQLEAAQAVLEDFVSLEPDHSNGFLVLGSVRINRVNEVSIFKKVGLAKAGIAAWRTAAALDPSNVEARYGVVSFLFNAPSIVGGDPEQAVLELENLRQLSPAYAQLVDAEIHFKAERFETAEKVLDAASKQISDRAFPTIIQASYFYQQGKYTQAIDKVADYRQRSKAWNDPGDAQVGLMAGNIFAAINDQNRARSEFSKALSQNPPKHIRQKIEDALKAL